MAGKWYIKRKEGFLELRRIYLPDTDRSERKNGGKDTG